MPQQDRSPLAIRFHIRDQRRKVIERRNHLNDRIEVAGAVRSTGGRDAGRPPDRQLAASVLRHQEPGEQLTRDWMIIRADTDRAVENGDLGMVSVDIPEDALPQHEQRPVLLLVLLADERTPQFERGTDLLEQPHVVVE